MTQPKRQPKTMKEIADSPLPARTPEIDAKEKEMDELEQLLNKGKGK